MKQKRKKGSKIKNSKINKNERLVKISLIIVVILFAFIIPDLLRNLTKMKQF